MSGVVGNRRSHLYHKPTCRAAAGMADKNRVMFGSYADVEAAGYRKARDCWYALGPQIEPRPVRFDQLGYRAICYRRRVRLRAQAVGHVPRRGSDRSNMARMSLSVVVLNEFEAIR